MTDAKALTDGAMTCHARETAILMLNQLFRPISLKSVHKDVNSSRDVHSDTVNVQDRLSTHFTRHLLVWNNFPAACRC
jgi:hypothetical protein